MQQFFASLGHAHVMICMVNVHYVCVSTHKWQQSYHSSNKLPFKGLVEKSLSTGLAPHIHPCFMGYQSQSQQCAWTLCGVADRILQRKAGGGGAKKAGHWEGRQCWWGDSQRRSFQASRLGDPEEKGMFLWAQQELLWCEVGWKVWAFIGHFLAGFAWCILLY